MSRTPETISAHPAWLTVVLTLLTSRAVPSAAAALAATEVDEDKRPRRVVSRVRMLR